MNSFLLPGVNFWVKNDLIVLIIKRNRTQSKVGGWGVVVCVKKAAFSSLSLAEGN